MSARRYPVVIEQTGTGYSAYSPDVWPWETRRKRRDGTFRMPWLPPPRPCGRSASRFRSRTRPSITWKSPHRDLVLGGPYCGFKPFFALATSAVRRRCFVAVADCCPLEVTARANGEPQWATRRHRISAFIWTRSVSVFAVAPLHLHPSFPS